MVEQKINHPVLDQAVKLQGLTTKRLIPNSTMAGSLRPMPSLKRRKTLKPKALAPLHRKVM